MYFHNAKDNIFTVMINRKSQSCTISLGDLACCDVADSVTFNHIQEGGRKSDSTSERALRCKEKLLKIHLKSIESNYYKTCQSKRLQTIINNNHLENLRAVRERRKEEGGTQCANDSVGFFICGKLFPFASRRLRARLAVWGVQILFHFVFDKFNKILFPPQ